jgi:hypothetical protein
MGPDIGFVPPVLVFMIPLAGMALTGFVVWIVLVAWKHRTETRAATEFNSRLLERISSFKDFSDFAQSEQGARMMRGLPTALHSTPRDRILRAVSSGIVITMLGAGLFFMAIFVQSRTAVFLGGVTIALGVGFLISAAVSYQVAKSLGVLEMPERPGRLD